MLQGRLDELNLYYYFWHMAIESSFDSLFKLMNLTGKLQKFGKDIIIK